MKTISDFSKAIGWKDKAFMISLLSSFVLSIYLYDDHPFIAIFIYVGLIALMLRSSFMNSTLCEKKYEEYLKKFCYNELLVMQRQPKLHHHERGLIERLLIDYYPSNEIDFMRLYHFNVASHKITLQTASTTFQSLFIMSSISLVGFGFLKENFYIGVGLLTITFFVFVVGVIIYVFPKRLKHSLYVDYLLSVNIKELLKIKKSGLIDPEEGKFISNILGTKK